MKQPRVLVLLILNVVRCCAKSMTGVKWNKDAFELSIAPSEKVTHQFDSFGVYSRNVSGWNYLDLQSAKPNSVEDLMLKMEAVGILEGYLTCEDLQISYPNFYADNFGKTLPSKEFINFIIDNYIWMVEESDKYYKHSDYWLFVKSSLTQVHGMLNGYLNSPCVVGQPINSVTAITAISVQHLSKETLQSTSVDDFSRIKLLHLLLLNSWGDIYSITSAFSAAKQQQQQQHSGLTSLLTEEGILKRRRIPYPDTVHEIQRDLRCSSLIKILPDYSDILFGHATWGSYIALAPRIFKHTVFPSVHYTGISDGSATPGVQVSMRSNYFSSSPGILASLDDFYIISSVTEESSEDTGRGSEKSVPDVDLVVIETTNDMMNPQLHSLITPQHNLCWMRVLTANNLATDGKSWAQLFGSGNSGTYTNQWQVMDMNHYTPNEGVEPGFFTLLEEVPGTVVSADLTTLIANQTYWASYNVPYFAETYELSGNKLACDAYTKQNPNDTDYCWDRAPRALIFAERQAAVKTIADFQYLINFNNWEHDPLSLGDACKSIACRRDLELDPSLVYPSGGLDAKVSSYRNSRSSYKRGDKDSNVSQKSPLRSGSSEDVRITVRLGPTKDDQPVFCWSQLKEQYVHLGQPDCFDYDWLTLPL